MLSVIGIDFGPRLEPMDSLNILWNIDEISRREYPFLFEVPEVDLSIQRLSRNFLFQWLLSKPSPSQIFPELSQVDEGSGIILSKDRNCCIMINEEDHLRIQVLHAGLDFKSVWKKVDELDSGIASELWIT